MNAGPIRPTGRTQAGPRRRTRPNSNARMMVDLHPFDHDFLTLLNYLLVQEHWSSSVGADLCCIQSQSPLELAIWFTQDDHLVFVDTVSEIETMSDLTSRNSGDDGIYFFGVHDQSMSQKLGTSFSAHVPRAHRTLISVTPPH